MNTQNVVPLGEYVLLSIDDSTNDSSGLLLSTQAQDNKGIVKAIGDKVNTDEESTKVNVDDKVIFIPGSGVKLTNSEESDILISIKNIIGIIKGEK